MPSAYLSYGSDQDIALKGRTVQWGDTHRHWPLLHSVTSIINGEDTECGGCTNKFWARFSLQVTSSPIAEMWEASAGRRWSKRKEEHSPGTTGLCPRGEKGCSVGAEERKAARPFKLQDHKDSVSVNQAGRHRIFPELIIFLQAPSPVCTCTLNLFHAHPRGNHYSNFHYHRLTLPTSKVHISRMIFCHLTRFTQSSSLQPASRAPRRPLKVLL